MDKMFYCLFYETTRIIRIQKHQQNRIIIQLDKRIKSLSQKLFEVFE